MSKDKREEEFLEAIRANPADRATRLIYADWLEERGIPTAQLIRIEEEMRTLPVYSDRYWQLKPRRNELRAGCDQKWLETMRYGSDYEPIFHDLPSGWKERWRFIRELLDRWHRVSLVDVGGQRNRVREIESSLGYGLPESVHEWIALLYDLIDGDGYERVFRDCLSFTEVEGHPAVSLMIQGENDYHWAVNKEHLREADPPVDGYVLDYDVEERQFVHERVWAPEVTTWSLIHIITYLNTLAGEGGGFGTHVRNATELGRRLADAFPVSVTLAGLRVFEAPNIVATISTYGAPYLNVALWKRIPEEELPLVLRECKGGDA
jgi:uncharacterized protein (TIGR02996 family)